MQTWFDDKYYWTVHFDTSLSLTLIQGHGSAWKQKLLHKLSHKVFSQFKWNVVYSWDLLVWWTSYSFYLIHSVFKGENPTSVILFKKTLALTCIQTWWRWIVWAFALLVVTIVIIIIFCHHHLGGQTSSVGSVLALLFWVMQHCGFGPPLSLQ